MVASHPLRRRQRPNFEAGDNQIVVVDLFAGCGGLTLGAGQAARERGLALEVALAVDFEAAALAVYSANFPKARARVSSVESHFAGNLGESLSAAEQCIRDEIGPIDLLMGGPPCQGHSNLNNHTRREDPKNGLYLRMARAVEVLRPKALIIENVPGVIHDSQRVVERTKAHLEGIGYEVASIDMELARLGIPQTRRRHILLAVSSGALVSPATASGILNRLQPEPQHDLRWAIGDLELIQPMHWIDEPSKASPANQSRIRWLIENDEVNLPNALRPACHQGNHSYRSMYGRLSWDLPAQTITSGFGSMGQGRYVHPSRARTLTPHEAARIQGFPDYFSFGPTVTRTQLSVILGNAVPPALTRALVGALIDNRVLGQGVETVLGRTA